MKLGTKIVLGFVAVCVIFVVLSALVTFALFNVQNSSRTLQDEVTPVMIMSSTAQFTLARAALFTVDYTYSGNQASWNQAQELADSLVTQLQQLHQEINSGVTSTNPALIERERQFQEQFATFAQARQLLPGLQKTSTDARTTLDQGFAEFMTGLDKMIEDQQKNLADALRQDIPADEVMRRMDITKALSDVENAASFMMLAVQRGFLLRDLSQFDQAEQHIQELVQNLNLVISTTQMPAVRQEAEALAAAATGAAAGAVAQTRAAMAQSLEAATKRFQVRDAVLAGAQELNNSLAEMAMALGQASLTSIHRVLITLVIGLAAALVVSILMSLLLTRSITKPIDHLIEVLSQGAHEVDNASSQLSAASNTLAEGATENAASLEETSAALEELSSMTKRNADNAVEANSLMNQANEAVLKADESMTNVIQAMIEISTSGNEINKIIKTIDEIAFQTNLLALNAAVEAARAGEAGAGFAVVADEVRNLAIRSADAAKNTADLIASTISNINSGQAMVNATAENFKTVESHSSKVAHLLGEVSEASKEQSQGIGQITTAMQEMDKVTQSNAAAAEESAGAASELSRQATELLSAVDSLTRLVDGHGDTGVTHRRSLRKPKTVQAPKAASAAHRALPMEDEDGFDF